MNKIKFIGTLLLGSLLTTATMSSCDDMLETKNFTDMTPDNFFKTKSDLEAAVAGLYAPCRVGWGYTDGGTGSWYPALYTGDASGYYVRCMTTTDEMTTYWASDDYRDFVFGPSTSGAIYNVYNTIRFVARATDIINQIENSNGATEAERLALIAETKTLRAFYMYVLMDFYGPVNVKLDPATLSGTEITPRPSLEEYEDYIKRDLDDAINTQSFIDKYNGDESNWGRMSKAIAYGVRMRLNLYKKDWAAVSADCKQLENMGFELCENYADCFDNDEKEAIYSIAANTSGDYANHFMVEVMPSDFKKGYNENGDDYIKGTADGYKSGWASYCMNWDFYHTFYDENDVRKQCMLVTYEDLNGNIHSESTGMTGAIPVKFWNTENNVYDDSQNMPVIRLAEVYLSHAEAENEINGPQAAMPYLKKVTDRAKETIPASVTANKEAMSEFILAERGRELFCEGQRRTDLIRFGKFISSAQARGKNAKSHQVLFPIPQSVITEAGGKIEQNSGYTN